MGESITEATVGQWFKQAGDAVAADEPLVELETDKVTVEVPAPASGVLSEIMVKTGDTVAVGVGARRHRRRRRQGEARARSRPRRRAAACPSLAGGREATGAAEDATRARSSASPREREEVERQRQRQRQVSVERNAAVACGTQTISPRPGFRRQASSARAAAAKC